MEHCFGYRTILMPWKKVYAMEHCLHVLYGTSFLLWSNTPAMENGFDYGTFLCYETLPHAQLWGIASAMNQGFCCVSKLAKNLCPPSRSSAPVYVLTINYNKNELDMLFIFLIFSLFADFDVSGRDVHGYKCNTYILLNSYVMPIHLNMHGPRTRRTPRT